MKFKALFSILGKLLILMSAFLLLFTVIAILAYPTEGQGIYFLLSALTTGFCGMFLYIVAGDTSDTVVSFREGFAVAGLGWIFIALFGALPAYLSNDIPTYTDAFFESMSGFTTTGASILSNIEALGHTVLIWRSFAHWLGGMGIIVLTLAILPALGIGGIQLFKAEVPGPTPDKLVPKIAETSRLLYSVYSFLTLAQFILLWGGGMNVFESVCHTLGTMGTGGFSPLNGSIGQYSTMGNHSALYFEIIIIFFMFLAGANFSLHYKGIRGDFKPYLKDPEFKFYTSIVLIAILFISFDLYFHKQYESIGTIVRNASFSVVSIITTTGYSTANFDSWPGASKFIILFLMFIGGTTGSTGGGIKVLRIITLFKVSLVQIRSIIHPRRIETIRFGDIHIQKDVLNSIQAFLLIFLVIYASSILVLATTNLDYESISSMVVACLANIGPGFAKVGPTQNYGDLPSYAKWILSFLMVVGRLELFPILALLMPKTWVK